MKREKRYKVQSPNGLETYSDLSKALRRFKEIEESPKKVIELTDISERVLRNG